MIKCNFTSIQDLAVLGDPSFKFTIVTDKPEWYVVHPSVSPDEDVTNAPEELRRQFLSAKRIETPSRTITFLENCYVLPNAAIVTAGGNLIAESCLPYVPPWIGRFFDPWIKETGNGYEARIDDAELVEPMTLYLREHGENGFFHWMHSVLPRLDVTYTQQLSSDCVLLVASGMKFQRQSLSLAGADRLAPLAPNATRPQFFRRLLFPSPLVAKGDFWLRPLSVGRFYEKLPIQDRSGPKRIYVSRHDALVRRLSNEDELLTTLGKLGFVALELASLSFMDQISIFRGCDIVIGCHGAGLSHIVSMKSGSSVLEILHPRRFWPTYRAISARQGLQYGFVLGNNKDESVKGDTFDFEVSVDKTLGVLARLGVS